MKKKILIFSAGSAGREVNQLISSINKISEDWEVVGYVDNNKSNDHHGDYIYLNDCDS